MYPSTGRLQCHTCVDGDCSDPTDGHVELCPRYGADEKCVSMFTDNEDKVIARGCLSTLETQYQNKCNGNDTNCFKCAYDNCNKDDSKKKLQFCIVCNSQDDPNCLKDNTRLEQRCLTNRCYTRLNGQDVERGCMDDIQTCSRPSCTYCRGKNCNNKKFPRTRISCKSCQFDSCKGRVTEKICNRYVEKEACITFYGDKNNVVLRDCYADLAEGARDVCDDPTNLECTKCTNGSLCNVDAKRRGNKCYKCEGIECLRTSISDAIDCLSECYVGINSKGETVRGCAADFTNAKNCGSTDQTCSICDDDLCNNMIFPTKDRLQCQKCQGQDCLMLKVETDYCEVFNKDEKCLTVFNAQNEVIERSCMSAIMFRNSKMCTDNKCLNCGFDECNVAASSDEKYQCVSCTSEDDENCVISPNSTSVIGCSTNSCYSVMISQTHIERGCALENEDCSPANNCELCKGERCNSQAFPKNRHSCYYCSGDHCALGHLHQRLCVSYNQNDKSCMTLYGEQKEVIYRGCYIDAVRETRELCDDVTDLTCTKCSGKLCNSDSKRRGTRCVKCEGLECFGANDRSNSVDCLSGGCFVGLNENGDVKRDCASTVATSSKCVKDDKLNGTCLVCDDDYCNAVIYPMNNRLLCQSCIGELCDEKLNDEKFCERIHPNEKCVTVFNSANKVIERGCSSSLTNERACQANPGNCLACGFARCNIQESKADIYHCASCNSKDDPNCVRDTPTPIVQACSTNMCYSRIIPMVNSNWYHVEKGCAANLQRPSSCTGGNSGCTICQGDRCNNIVYPVDRMSCLTCRNNECNANGTAASMQKFCRLYNRQLQGCITLYDVNDKVNFRGCFSDAAVGTQEVCNDISELLCTKCSNRNCNVDTKRRGKKCFKCSGLDCFTPNYPADIVECLSDCYVGVNAAGETVRDCASAIANTTSCSANDDENSRCVVCSDDLCNAIQFPTQKRLKCHTCDNPSDCPASETNLKYCERFGDQEKCVTAFSPDNKVIERGCQSSIKNKLYCSQNYKNCFECKGDGCNNQVTKSTKLCVICNSLIDPNCVLNPALVPSKLCIGGCYTRIESGNLVRGCLSDLGMESDCTDANQCKQCRDSDKCNSENYPADRRSCFTCEENCTMPVERSCVKYAKDDKCVTIFNACKFAY